MALTALAVVAAGAPMATATAGSDHTTDRTVLVWGSSPADAAEAVEDAGGEVEATLAVVGGVAARLTDRQTTLVRRTGLQVNEDAPMAVAGEGFEPVPPSDHQFAAINPGDDWNLDAGAGVGVALIDTGVTEVEDLRGRVVQGPDLSGEGTTTDTYGHGTFMAGLIAGDGNLSAAGTSRHVGVAPGAHIVSVKVAGADGDTTLGRVIEGIGWAIENSERYGIRVMNLSVAVPPLSSSYRADPLSAAVEAAWASGITVVAAAGNDGSHVSSPGRDPWVITVGALDTGDTLGPDDDSVPAWSGRESTPRATKPELLAPGVSVISLAAPGSTVAQEFPGSVVEEHYFVGSGTSMAAAMTAGAVAVLTEHHVAATPDDFKAALVSTGRPVPGELGRALDLTAADLSTAGSPEEWWQQFPVAFNGLGIGLHDRMPWAEAGSDPEHAAWVDERWAG
ncbi:MAG: S8 family serine peptidase, partial [Actinobacteria bacterium]|nr:S8 family serine peptidase [Actinomycetota bacterium]